MRLTSQRRLTLTASALALMTAAAPSLGSAGVYVWNGGTDLFNNLAAWTPAGVPGGGDDAQVFAAGSNVEVFGINASVGTMELGVSAGSGNLLTINASNFGVDLGSFTNNGTISIANNSRFGSGSGPLNISGTGTIVLDDTTGFARLFENGGFMTLGAGQTVRGSGAIGLNDPAITNNGLISADVNGRTIDIDPAGGNGGIGGGLGASGAASFLNNGTLQATGGGNLQLDGGYFDNTSGLIVAQAGSTVTLANDVRIAGGNLQSVGTGVINAHGGNQYLQTLTLAAGSNLDVNGDNVSLNTTFVNNGTVTVSNNSRLNSESGGNLTISGTGTIVLNNSTGFARLFENGGIMTLGSNQTITGSGQIGLNDPVIVNNGFLSLTGGGTIDLDVAAGNGGVATGTGVGTGTNSAFLNNGTVSVAGGSTLYIEGGLYENAAGHAFAATGGSTINLQNDARILNGSLSSDATSIINAHGGNQYLQALTLASGSKLDVNSDNVLLNTTFVNNGTVTVSNNSRLDSEGGGNLTISGTGTIVLNNSTGFARLFENGGIMTLGSNQTITGSGQIGLNDPAIVNNGFLSLTGGGSIDLDVAGGNGGISGGVGTGSNSAFLNNGTVSVAGGSTLYIEGGLYENAAGHAFAATGGSTINLQNDARILNGSLSSDATSIINARGGNQYLQTLTLAAGSKLDVNSDNVLLNTTFVNNGTVTVSNNSRLDSEGSGALTISGAGTIVLDNSTGFAHLFENGGIMTLGSNQTITGSGQIGLNDPAIVNNGFLSLTGGGSIDLDVAGGNGGISGGVGTGSNSAFLNNGTVSVAEASTLSIEGGLYENAAGHGFSATGGSTIDLNNDVRFLNGSLSSDATSIINAHGGNQYLQALTLASGSNLDINSDNVLLNTTFVNNGTVTLSNNSRLNSETGALTVSGTGTITLNDTTGFAHLFENGGVMTLGSGQNVHGSGNIGLNDAAIVNNGTISGDVSGRNLDIDPAGGNGGITGGLGSSGAAAFFNTGTVQSTGGGTTTLEGGLYENSATGTFAAFAGSATNMAGDSSLYNLQAGGVLNLGVYESSTLGAASLLSLRSNAANAIVTIGTGGAATDTVVVLRGANSTLGVTGFSSGVFTPLEASLTTVATSGKLLIDTRTFNAANGLTNAGVISLLGGTLGAPSFNNSGLTYGSGAVTVDIANTGTVDANGGTLATRTITGPSGTIMSEFGSTLDLSAATADSTAGTLTNNGSLVLGSHNVTVTTDYANANFGSGNAFNRRANVTGSGDIYGVNYTVDLSGPALSGGVIDVGNVRTGGSSSTTLTITNNGTATNIVGAVQNASAPSIALDHQDFALAHGGGSTTVTLSYTGSKAGALTGQSIAVVNNFANVGTKTIGVTGNVYQIAIAGAQPSTVTLGASRVGGAAQSSALTIANVAPDTAGFTEALTSTASTSSPFLVNGGASATVSNIAAGGSAPVTVSLGTGTAGAFSNTVAISNTSIPVAGSGFSNLVLAGQSVTVSGNVYAPAVASLSSNAVAFGPVRQGATNPTQSLSLTNASTGALSDQLLTSAGTLPTGVTATTPGALNQGQSGNVVFALSTATAGQVSGSGALNFTSHDTQLSDLTLPSQSVSFTGTVTQLAQALVTKNAGAGTLSGAGATYTLNLGSFVSGTGVQSSTLGVTNNIPNSSFSEFLNGTFSAASKPGFSFAGQTFSGLSGGSNAGGDVLSFDTTGDAAGTYTDVLTFTGYSSFPGESNYALGTITVDVTVDVTGGGGGGPVPEPATWAMMLVGFGLIGGVMRRRTGQQARHAA